MCHNVETYIVDLAVPMRSAASRAMVREGRVW